MKSISIIDLQNKKTKSEPIVMLTCYDATFAKIFDQSGVDILFIGDSLGMTIQGAENTLNVSMQDMIYHTRCVSKATKQAHVLTDLPFMSYQLEPKQALKNSADLVRAGAQSVKLEGGKNISSAVKIISESGIPVMGHLGLTPQSVHTMGGYRIQGKSEEAADKIFEDALSLEKAGAYALVLECVPENLAKKISLEIKIPTIGIGAGRYCDGQVLVCYDLLGLNPEFKPKFLKTYLDGGSMVQQACEAFVTEVRQGKFPEEKHSIIC